MRGKTIIAGIVIFVIAASLAATDYALREAPLSEDDSIVAVEENEQTPSSSSSSAEATSSSAASEQPVVVKKGVSTKKQGGASVAEILAKLQLVESQTTEASFLSFAVPNASAVRTSVLLKNNDRALLFAWIETDDVKPLFSGLKQALQTQFSGKVTNLIDETRVQDNGPPVDVLSFLDPGLSPETILFVRVRNRLYEMHIADNGADVVSLLVAELSK